MFKEVAILLVISSPFIMGKSLTDLYEDKMEGGYPLLDDNDDVYSQELADAAAAEGGAWSKRASNIDPHSKFTQELAMVIRKILAPKFDEYKRRSPSRAPLYVFKRLFDNQDSTES